MAQFNYLIGTGWWCSGNDIRVEGRPYHGADIIRGAEFHHLWSAIIDGWTSPQAVFIVDSASPQKPPITNPNYRLLTLATNPGHATVHSGHYSGWTASVLHSLEYALSADADYLVYVEQDVLLHGHGVIEYCISRMRKPLMFGSGAGTPQPLQQSFFIVRKDGMREFLSGLHAIRERDRNMSPEWKFMLASLGARGRAIEWIFTRARLRDSIHKLFGRLMQAKGFDVLPIGYGRARPMQMTAPFHYFQQGGLSEVQEFLALLPDSILQAAISRSASLRSIAAARSATSETRVTSAEDLKTQT